MFRASVLYDAVRSGDKSQLVNVLKSTSPSNVRKYAADAFCVACEDDKPEAAQVLCDFWSELSTVQTLLFGMFSQMTWGAAQKAMWLRLVPIAKWCH